MKKTLTLAAALAASLSATPALAAEIFFNNEAAFNAANATVLEDFNDAGLVPGLTITSSVGSISGGLFNDRLVAGGAQTLFTFATPISSFGGIFNLSPGGQGQGIRITLSGGRVLTTEVPNSLSGTFFGFSSDTAFTSVLFQGGTQPGSAETYNLDNLRFGAASAGVPEPSTWAMMLLGFAGIGFSLRRRRRADSTTLAYA